MGTIEQPGDMSTQARVITALDSVHPEVFSNEVERLQVRAAARRLLARLETPYERAWGFCFEHPVVFAALQVCIDLGIWKAWTDMEGGEKSISELAELANTNVDVNLLREFSFFSPKSGF